MKKLIAISVMMALVAGAAFAQASFGASAEMGTTFIHSENGADASIGGTWRDQFMIGVSYSEDNYGAYLRFRPGDMWGQMWYVWWQPNDYVKFKVGTGDGDFGAGQITGWGWTQNAKLGGSFGGAAYDNRGFDDSGVFTHGGGMYGVNFDASHGFYGGTGWNAFRFNVSLYPIEALEINTSLTGIGGSASDAGNAVVAKDIINNLHLNAVYRIAGTGDVRVSAVFGDGKSFNDPAGTDPGYFLDWGWNTTKVYASFYLTAIDGMGLDIGVGYRLPGSGDVSGIKVEWNAPIEIGLGFNYRVSDDFNFKLRAAALVAGSYKTGGISEDLDTCIAFDINPSYNLGFATAYLQAGLNMVLPDVGDSVIGWFFNPYINYQLGGSVTLWTGLKVWGTSGLPVDPKASWAVPLTVIINLN